MREIFIISSAIILLFVILIVISIIKTLFIKNKKTRILNIEKVNNDRSDFYSQRLLELIQIKTTSYEEGEVYHIFREKIKEQFPLIHKNFIKEKIGPNAIFTYNGNNSTNKLLIVTHIDTLKKDSVAKIENDEIYGPGTFDSKALLFTVMQAIEELLQEKKDINFNLTFMITVDDTTTKSGNEKVVDKFLRQGTFFKLVLEEGIGIIEPTYLNMKSHYALLGIGVTGEVKIRYKINKSRSKNELINFVEDIRVNKIFKSEIDKNSFRVLSEFSKDMPFLKRLLFGNIWLYKYFVKRIVNNNVEFRLAKLLRTYIIYNPVFEDEDSYYVDFTFELASHDTTAEIIGLMNPYVIKHNVNFEIKSLKDPSKVTDIKQLGYKIVEDTVKKTYDSVYSSPYIITKISEQRNLSRVSDCVVRFSPLYYSKKALLDAEVGEDHVMKKSITLGVDFYKNLIQDFNMKYKNK